MIGWKAGIAAVALIAAAGIGYTRGAADTEAKYKSRILAQIEAARKLDAARLKVVRARDALARELEKKAYAEPVVVSDCIGPNRVRRLNSLR